MDKIKQFSTIRHSAFAEYNYLPYFRNIPKDGRIAILNPVFDEKNNEWILLLPTSPDKLIRLKDGEPVQSCYSSFSPVDPNKDFELPIGTFVIQHLSFPGIIGAFFALETDFNNCCAVLEKYLLIANRDKSKRNGMGLLLRTELEYLISSVRSIYDQLQKLSKHASALVKDIKEPDKGIIANLPDSFADIVLQKDDLRTKEQIQEKYKLPEPLADFYALEASHFKWLRELRVSIEHHGKTVSTIFDLDEGAAISIQDYPWNNLPIWKEDKYIRNNHLGSFRLVFSFLVDQVIEMTTRYVNAYAKSVKLPEAIEPEMKIYVRNYFSNHLISLKKTIESPWERLQS